MRRFLCFSRGVCTLGCLLVLAAPAFAQTQVVYETELSPGWMDFGWSPRRLNMGPAEVDVSNYGGWIISRPRISGDYSALEFRFQGGDLPSLIELRLEGAGAFPKVLLRLEHRLKTTGAWSTWQVPFSELNPESRTFEKLVFQGRKSGNVPAIRLDSIRLLAATSTEKHAPGAVLAAKSVVPTKLTLECSAPTKAISPLIYGTAMEIVEDKLEVDWDVGMTARRWGGNLTSRYNWKLGNAWNSGNDWFYRNRDYGGLSGGPAHEKFLGQNLEHKVLSALVVPMLGWVAKDNVTGGFPRSIYPEQQAMSDDYGNGRAPDGTELTALDPKLTSVAAPAEFIAAWVRDIRQKDQVRGTRSVHQYILDNEPMLWCTTHRDVHPEPATYDELLATTMKYAAVIRKEDPSARIAGPAEWGWTNYFVSAADSKTRAIFPNPDKRRHDNLPLVAWYLRELRTHEEKTKERLLDVLDLHFYPMAKGLGLGDEGLTDARTNALRIRATRALWDPTYKDESWINDTVRLIPRMREWINSYYPGLGISIGEYNFGAGWHMSGGLAQAEVLGRFGQQGVESAFFWTRPKKATPAYFAFRAFRNYDGHGGRFLDESLVTTVTDGRKAEPAEQGQVLVSLFASRGQGKLVLVALNHDPENAHQGELVLNGCAAVGSTRAFRYDGVGDGFREVAIESLKKLSLPPASITVLELSLAAGAGKPASKK